MTNISKTVYLKDGRMADLITQTDKGYLVDPYITWNDYEGQQESAPSGNIELVSEIFDTAPVELIEAEYKKILDKVEIQRTAYEERLREFNQLEAHVRRLRDEKTSLERVIINRGELRNAKRIIFWAYNEPTPRIMDGSKHDKLSITFEITQYKGEERAWCYRVSFRDDRFDFSEKIDAAYGIKVDLTDEEIMALTTERIARFKKESNWPWFLDRASNEWLSPEYLEEKKALKQKRELAELEDAKKDLQRAQEKVDKLQAKELTTN